MAPRTLACGVRATVKRERYATLESAPVWLFSLNAGLTVKRLSTFVTPGAAHAARSAS